MQASFKQFEKRQFIMAQIFSMNAEIYPHFYYFFSNFCKVLFQGKRSWQYFLMKQQIHAFFHGNRSRTAQSTEFARSIITMHAGEKDG